MDPNGPYKPSFLNDQELKHLIREVSLKVCHSDADHVVLVSWNERKIFWFTLYFTETANVFYLVGKSCWIRNLQIQKARSIHLIYLLVFGKSAAELWNSTTDTWRWFPLIVVSKGFTFPSSSDYKFMISKCKKFFEIET